VLACVDYRLDPSDTMRHLTNVWHRSLIHDVNTCVSPNVDRPRDLKEAFNIILEGLDDSSVSRSWRTGQLV